MRNNEIQNLGTIVFRTFNYYGDRQLTTYAKLGKRLLYCNNTEISYINTSPQAERLHTFKVNMVSTNSYFCKNASLCLLRKLFIFTEECFKGTYLLSAIAKSSLEKHLHFQLSQIKL